MPMPMPPKQATFVYPPPVGMNGVVNPTSKESETVSQGSEQAEEGQLNYGQTVRDKDDGQTEEVQRENQDEGDDHVSTTQVEREE